MPTCTDAEREVLNSLLNEDYFSVDESKSKIRLDSITPEQHLAMVRAYAVKLHGERMWRQTTDCVKNLYGKTAQKFFADIFKEAEQLLKDHPLPL